MKKSIYQYFSTKKSVVFCGTPTVVTLEVGDKSYNAIEHHIYLPDSGELFLVKSGRALQDALFQVQEQHQIRMEDWVFDVSYNREGGRKGRHHHPP